MSVVRQVCIQLGNASTSAPLHVAIVEALLSAPSARLPGFPMQWREPFASAARTYLLAQRLPPDGERVDAETAIRISGLLDCINRGRDQAAIDTSPTTPS